MKARSDFLWKFASHPVIFFMIVVVIGIFFDEMSRDDGVDEEGWS